jgi:hypothetical protein
MSDRQGRDAVIPLLLTGHETSATALSWTWYLLSRHPDGSARGIPISPSARVVHHGPSDVPDRPSDRPLTGSSRARLIGATDLSSRRVLVPGGHACASPYQTL